VVGTGLSVSYTGATAFEAVEYLLLEGSKPLFVFESLHTYEILGRIDASLQQSQQKGGIRC